MQDGRSLRIWVWVVAVLGYLILPVIVFFSVLGVGADRAFGGTSGPPGGVAGIGVFVIPILTWVITVSLHHERLTLGDTARDGVFLNWVGGVLVAGLVVGTVGSYVVPWAAEYLQTHERASVAVGAQEVLGTQVHGTGLSA
ncbi:MAG TPA: hypothetical protein VKY86_15450 [Promicromonospora sp.]|nr:hypothetical protein [Promicromonospora sp.]